MARAPLSSLDDWQLVNKDQDLRGRELYAPDGREVGTIREMIVDTDTQYVVALVLDNGTEIPTDDIRIDDDDDDKVFLERDIVAPTRPVATTVEREDVVASPRPRETTSVETGKEQVVPVVEEELQVGKRRVEIGGIRVIARVKEEPVEEHVTLRDETVNVERRPVNRPVTEADKAAMQDKTYEVHEIHEEPVVNKVAHITEEVRINKEVEQHTETVRDTVRRTEVDVEREPDQSDNS